MKRLRKFLVLTPSDRRLLISAILVLGTIRIGLKILPLRTLHHFLVRSSQLIANLQETDQIHVDRVVWAVKLASRHIRGVRCLAQALAAQALLSWRGYPTELRIGFTRNKRGRILAHAWVESQGQIVIGDTGNIASYIFIPLKQLDNQENSRWYLLNKYQEKQNKSN